MARKGTAIHDLTYPNSKILKETEDYIILGTDASIKFPKSITSCTMGEFEERFKNKEDVL